MTHYTDLELRRAFALTAYTAGLDFETAMRNPIYAKVIEAKAASDRQLRRELARRAEQARAGRWLELRADPLASLDAYDLTDRTAHLGEVAA